MKNKEAVRLLKSFYNNAARTVNAAAGLENLFYTQKDKKRQIKAHKAVEFIMKAQEVLNELGEEISNCK